MVSSGRGRSARLPDAIDLALSATRLAKDGSVQLVASGRFGAVVYHFRDRCAYLRITAIGEILYRARRFVLKPNNKNWRTSRRVLDFEKGALVMAIINATPDSFSDGGAITGVDDALRRAEKFIDEGADILDVGGESTRPGSTRVGVEEEIARVVPVIEAIAGRFDIPISVDTSKAEVAQQALAAGAEIVNDISALRFDQRIGEVAASTNAGLVLMHSRGEFETMHKQEPVADIMSEVSDGFQRALVRAKGFGLDREHVVLDVGIGFGKTQEQNLELLAKLGKLTAEFPDYPIMVGTSRKSFIGKLLRDAPVVKRLSGSLVTAAIAIWNGASVVRVHDVRETVDIVEITVALRDQL